jgi:hypothetical protein
LVDIFDEVDEELRAESAQKLVKRYSGLIAAAAFAVLGAAGGWQGWQWWQARQDAAAATAFVSAASAADGSDTLDPAARLALGSAFAPPR